MPPKGRTKDVSKSKTTRTETPLPALKWPPLRPLVPRSDLSLDILLANQIVVIRQLFTSTLSKSLVSFLSNLDLITTPATPRSGEALRVNDRLEVNDKAFAQMLWQATALEDLVRQSATTGEVSWGGEVVGLNPRIRIYRYKEGQFFAPHYDESNNVVLPTSPPTTAKTTWTLLVYLTGAATGCVGGETVFYPELGKASKTSGKSEDEARPMAIELEAGMALLHKHGQDCMLHEGKVVTKGEKWVIRSDLCVRR